MKAILTVLATLAVVAGAWAQGDSPKGPAPAAPGAPGGPPPHHGPGGPGGHGGPGGGMGQRLHEADTDKDGKVSFAEAQKAIPDITKERFDTMDANHDGFLTPEDRPKGEGPGGRGGFGERLKAADTDKDGKVSFAEAQKAFPQMTKENFDRRDTNHDGFLTPEDRPEGGGFQQRFNEADTNHDGKLTFEEAQKAFPNMDKERFSRMDTNGDGAITPEDRPQRRGPGGEHHGPPPAPAAQPLAK